MTFYEKKSSFYAKPPSQASPFSTFASLYCHIHSRSIADLKDTTLSVLLLPGQPRQTRGSGRSAGEFYFLRFLMLSHKHTFRWNNHFTLQKTVGISVCCTSSERLITLSVNSNISRGLHKKQKLRYWSGDSIAVESSVEELRGAQSENDSTGSEQTTRAEFRPQIDFLPFFFILDVSFFLLKKGGLAAMPTPLFLL